MQIYEPNELNKLRYKRMLKMLKMSINDVSKLTGNTPESIRANVARKIPALMMLSVNLFEFHNNISNYLKYKDIKDLFKELIESEDFEDNNERVESLINHLNFGFMDFELTEQKKMIVEVFKLLL